MGLKLKMLKAYSLAAALLLCCGYISSALAFNVDDGYRPATNAFVSTVTVQPDGKALIGGSFNLVNSIARNKFARINVDGSLDTTFDPGTGANSSVYAIAAQNDGKVLIGGSFSEVDGTSRKVIARLNSDGSLDTSFNPDIGAHQVTSLALQADGKILVGGGYHFIYRLNIDGTVDTTFDIDINGPLESIAIQSDGKIMIVGDFDTVNGIAREQVARLNTNGSLDPSFDPGVSVNYLSSLNSVAVQSDGQVLIGGWFTQYNGTNQKCIARLNTDGSLDTSFSPDVDDTSGAPEVNSMAIQPDGRILIGGSFLTVDGASRRYFARLNVNGSVDTSFNPGSGASSVHAIALQPDGLALIGGSFTSVNGSSHPYIARIRSDGKPDETLDVNGDGTDDDVNAIAVQPDGKVIVGGAFSNVDGTPSGRIARLSANGSQELGFAPGSGANNIINSIALQADGNMMVGGWFTQYDGTNRNRIARLSASGYLDASFDPGDGPNGIVEAIDIQPDGKLLIGGWFTQYDSTARNRIARLLPAGGLDTSFNPGSSANNIVASIALQPDGKVIVGGAFTTINGSTRNRIARLNANGSLDTTFNPGSGADNIVNAIALQPDGKVLIGGTFTSINGTTRNRIARLNSNGSLDTTFNPGSGANNTVNAIALQPDGKIVIGGWFSYYNSITHNRIVRLKANGDIDPTFGGGTGANDPVNVLAIQANGKILAGGQFTTFNSNPRNHIARISTRDAASLSLQGASSGDSLSWVREGAGPVFSSSTLELSTDSINWAAPQQGVRTSGGWKFNGINIPFNAFRYARLRGYYPPGSITEAVFQLYREQEACSFFIISGKNGKTVPICL